MLLEAAYNMTSGYSNATYAISNLTSWFPILAIAIAGAIVLGLILTSLSFWWFKKVFDFINGFTGTVRYVLYGGTVVCSFGVVSYGIFYFLSWNSENSIPLWYYPLGAVGYALLYAVGKVSENVYQRLERNYNKTMKKPEEKKAKQQFVR